MKIARILRKFLGACVFVLPLSALAQFPSGPVTIVVPFSAGGPTDAVARVLAEGLAKTWNQSVFVENRAGAAGVIGSDRVAKSKPDGHTLLAVASGPIVINPFLYKQLPFAPLKDLAPVSQLGSGPVLMFVSSTLPVKNISEFLEYARKNPGKLNFATAGIGSLPHLIAEMLMQETGIKMVHVPFVSTPQATASVASGEAQVVFDTPTALTYVSSGKLRPLMVVADARLPGASDVPTGREAGLPSMVVDPWYGLFAPAKTSDAVVKKIYADVADVIRSKATQDRLATLGFTPLASTPDEFRRALSIESDHWKKVISSARIEPQ